MQAISELDSLRIDEAPAHARALGLLGGTSSAHDRNHAMLFINCSDWSETNNTTIVTTVIITKGSFSSLSSITALAVFFSFPVVVGP